MRLTSLLAACVLSAGCSHTYYHVFNLTTDPAQGVSLSRKDSGTYLGKAPKKLEFVGDSNEECRDEFIVAEKSGYAKEVKRLRVCPEFEDREQARQSATRANIVLQPETRVRQRVIREQTVEEAEDAQE